MKKENQKTLMLVIGILLMPGALLLNRVVQMPDFFKGFVYGIGLGLIILFIIKKKRSRNVVV